MSRFTSAATILNHALRQKRPVHGEKLMSEAAFVNRIWLIHAQLDQRREFIVLGPQGSVQCFVASGCRSDRGVLSDPSEMRLGNSHHQRMSRKNGSPSRMWLANAYICSAKARAMRHCSAATLGPLEFLDLILSRATGHRKLYEPDRKNSSKCSSHGLDSRALFRYGTGRLTTKSTVLVG